MTNAYITILALIGAATLARIAFRVIINLYLGGFDHE